MYVISINNSCRETGHTEWSALSEAKWICLGMAKTTLLDHVAGSLEIHQAKIERLRGMPVFVSDLLKDRGSARFGRQSVVVLHWQLLRCVCLLKV